MTALLLALSLLLNIFALFAIIVLFLRQNKLLETEKKQEKMHNEMEEIISSYLVQMKEENDDFINRVSRLKENELSLKEEPEKKLVTVQENTGENEKKKRFAKASSYQAVKAYKKNLQPAGDQAADNKMEFMPESDYKTNGFAERSATKEQPSLPDNILLLKKQGLTEDQIAKSLGKGKTEIALMLKFRQNQQE